MVVRPRATRATARRRARLVLEQGKLVGGSLAGLRRRHHTLHRGFGRIVACDTELPNLYLAINLVEIG